MGCQHFLQIQHILFSFESSLYSILLTPSCKEETPSINKIP